jgi:hypothetical protein
MPHTYVVQSATYTPVPGTDPQVTLVGTVDGTPVTVYPYLSDVRKANQQGGLPSVKNLVAALMLAALPPPPVAPVELPTGTFTQ